MGYFRHFRSWREMAAAQEPDALPPCPFCGGELVPGAPPWPLECYRCERAWRSLEEVKRDAANAAALDEYMEREP